MNISIRKVLRSFFFSQMWLYSIEFDEVPKIFVSIFLFTVMYNFKTSKQLMPSNFKLYPIWLIGNSDKKVLLLKPKISFVVIRSD